MEIKSFVCGEWVSGSGKAATILHAVNGEAVGSLSSGGLDYKAILNYAREVGTPALSKMTFHERGRMLKALAQYLMSRKDELYELSYWTGATKADSWIDIEGGIGTFYTYAGKARREFPDDTIFIEGKPEAISKGGSFIGHHMCVPLEGAAIHINAFNFPVWGMLEKLSTNFVAGIAAIVKPASITSYLAAKTVEIINESGILPKGALQIICGSVGDLFDHLTCQDVVTFTGSKKTGLMLKSHPRILDQSIRFNMEADSLNCSILGPDAVPGSEEFDLYIKEVVREITVKSGQKCTAIRRAIVPKNCVAEVIKALSGRLAKNVIGDPKVEGVRMGPLVGLDQVAEVKERVKELLNGSKIAYGDLDSFEVQGADRKKGAFFPAIILHCEKPLKDIKPHSIEAFGPVCTVMPYEDTDEAVALAKMGEGSLVGSLFTHDGMVARKIARAVAPWHGRLVILNRESAKESTGHGSPLPHLVHGGPGRAGGGEEMGGVRGVLHYMQRTAIQGHPSTVSSVFGEWIRGAEQKTDKIHPFRKTFDELQLGETLITHRRTVTESDVVSFAGISGDFFYAHMDDIAAKESIFEKRVAHGYFVLSAAAGLFVDPAPGPVLANYGLEALRFTKPVYIGDTIHARLTCMRKTRKETKEGMIPQGVVEWDVEVYNQGSEVVASYSILTLVKQ